MIDQQRSTQRPDLRTDWLDLEPHPAWVLVCLAAIAGVGWFDHFTAHDYGLGLAYLVPVAAAAWWLGPRAAAVCVGAAAVAWVADDRHWRPDGQLTVTAWNGFTRLLIFSVIAWALGRLRSERLEQRGTARLVLREQAAWQDALIAGIKDVVFATTSDASLVYVSPSIRSLGYEPEDLVGSDALSFVHPDDEPLAVNVLQAILSDGTAPPVNLRLRHRDGSYVLHEFLGRRTTPDAPVAGIIGTARDVTERMAARAELERLGKVIEASSNSVVITDTRGTILYVNPAFETLTGYGAEEVVGRNPRLLKSGKQDDAFYGEMWAELASGGRFEGLFINRRKDGSTYTQDSVIFPITDDSGAVINLVGIGRDVTRERLLEGQLNQAQRIESLGRLAGGVAHDFNNILTVIIGEAEMLQGKQGEGEEGGVAEILRAGERAASLTRQLLAFSRRQEITPSVFSISDVVRDTERMLRRLLGEDLALTVRLAGDRCLVEADRGQVEQVLVNLCVNARDAMPRGGSLLVETARVEVSGQDTLSGSELRPGHYAVLTVKDTGAGMTTEQREMCFEPFFTTKQEGSGTGLGLSVCHGIVTQAGGSIEVESELGVGTTMMVFLPLVAEPAARSRAAAASAPRGTETVLLVEDDMPMLALVAKMLGSLGYTVVSAASAERALAALAGGGVPHLLVTDVVLPDVGGVELARKVRQLHPGIRTVFITGYTEDALLKHGFDAKTQRILHKPFTLAALAQEVRAALDA